MTLLLLDFAVLSGPFLFIFVYIFPETMRASNNKRRETYNKDKNKIKNNKKFHNTRTFQRRKTTRFYSFFYSLLFLFFCLFLLVANF